MVNFLSNKEIFCVFFIFLDFIIFHKHGQDARRQQPSQVGNQRGILPYV